MVAIDGAARAARSPRNAALATLSLVRILARNHESGAAIPSPSTRLAGDRTYREEFYDCSTPTVAGFKADLRRSEHTYNHIRPHQALGLPYPSPVPRYLEHQSPSEGSVTHVVNQDTV